MNLAPTLLLLEERARHDLACLNFPPPNWVPASTAPGGKTVLDVLVVGGGMCGQTAAFSLMREGVRNLRVIDRAAFGDEGPWGTFARMPILRSPKHLTGPDLGIASLSYRAWYEARHGAEGWAALYKAPRLEWLEYLLWVRRIAGIPVENQTSLTGLQPTGDLLRAEISGRSGHEVVYVRKVILALGRDGSGAQRWPGFASFDPAGASARAHVFHSADALDFASLKGKTVGVLGAGASAFDNAATALEAGAARVTLFARRPALPQVNKSKWASFPGFFHGFVALPDPMRWQFMTYIFSEQVPPPFESVLRCDRHANFEVRLGEPWLDLKPDADAVRVITPQAPYRFDAVVIATGFGVDMMERPEVSAFRGHVLTWKDRVADSDARQFPEESRFPYLGPGFELVERDPGALPAARNVHIFNWGSAISHGQLAGDIPGLATGATRVGQAVARDLFVADSARLLAALHAHAAPELKPTRFYLPP